jgi:hypothetical protein
MSIWVGAVLLVGLWLYEGHARREEQRRFDAERRAFELAVDAHHRRGGMVGKEYGCDFTD